MIPLTYINQAKARSDELGTTRFHDDDQFCRDFMDGIYLLHSRVPACRVAADGELVDLAGTNPVTPANWGTAIWLDDAYGPALVEFMISCVYDIDSADTQDAARAKVHRRRFWSLVRPSGQEE